MQAANETQADNETKATIRLAIWTLAWVSTLGVAMSGPGDWWDSKQVSWAAIAVNLVVGVGWIVAYSRLLRAVDELERKILQDALMVAFGVGWIVGFTFVVVDAADLITADANDATSLLAVLIGAAYMVTFAVGKIRYR